MSEHPAKGHALEGIIMVLIIAGLMTYVFNMASSDVVGAVGVGVLLVAVGVYAVLGLGRAKA